MKIQFKDFEVELKWSLRALMMYENISEKTFNPTNTTDMITFLYCIVVSSAKKYDYNFDTFIDELDENPEILTKMTQWMNSTAETNNSLKKN